MTHASSKIKALRSVTLEVPDLQVMLDFFLNTWHLEKVAQSDDRIFLAGSGSDAYLIALQKGTGPAKVLDVTLRAHDLNAIKDIQTALSQTQGQLIQGLHPLNEPGGGQAITLKDPDGRIYRVVCDDQARPWDTAHEHQGLQDMPIRLAHAVLNSHHIQAAQSFLETVFDFCLSDRTKIMAFMRCNDDHHSIAFGDTDNNALNHIAFLMPDLESVMRGGGRLKDQGYPIAWGPGRHGPGNNAFNYFVGPFDVVIEYTSEVQQIDDSYKAKNPEDWRWPTGRTDQWGISSGPSDALKRAQKAVMFANV